MRPAVAGPPVPDSDDSFEDWVILMGRWWADLLPRRRLEVDVFHPDEPAGVGNVSGCFF